MDLIFLIDKSGSMYGSEEDTIGGFNSFIKKEKEEDLNTKVTTIFFNHGYEKVYERKPLSEITDLTIDDYMVGGSTALLDAIGKTITDLDKKIDNKVLFVIITDGKENTSVEFSKSQIKNMIDNHSWEFIFLGADIDSYYEASHIGIQKSRVANYRKSDEGIERAYNSINNVTRCLRQDCDLEDSGWKDDLKEYD